MVSMKIGQKPSFEKTIAAVIACVTVVQGGCFIIPGLTFCALILAKSAIIDSAIPRLKACRVSATENEPRR